MTEESEIAKLATRFEAVKIAMTQDKNGHVLKLSIHPQDTPESIMRDQVGTRYMVVVVRVGDDDQPMPAKAEQEGMFAVKAAGMLAADAKFQQWLVVKGIADDVGEENAAAAIRTYCGVTSRSQLKQAKVARDKFLALRSEFADAVRRGQ